MIRKSHLLFISIFVVSLSAVSSTLGFDKNSTVVKKQDDNYREGFIEVDNGILYYEMRGSGKTIVLIHDGMIHSSTYDGQFDMLAKEYRVVRYDRRGYGKSPKPTKEYSNIGDLKKLFDGLAIENASFVGMSAGGGLAIDFTLEYPENVTSLVLIGAVVSGMEYTSHFMNRGGHMKPEDFQSGDPLRKYMTEVDPYTIYHENIAAKAKLKQYLDTNPHNAEFDKYTFNTGPRRTALGVLDEIKVPALILVGEYDIPDVHAHAGAIEAGIPNAKRIIINNSAHLIPIEKPVLITEKILEFLNDK